MFHLVETCVPYISTEKGNTVSMSLSFGNMYHLLHGSTIGQDVPLTSQPFITQKIKHPLPWHWHPNRSCSTEHDPWRLPRVIHVFPCHHFHVITKSPYVKHVPLTSRRSTNPRTEVTGHALCQFQHAPPTSLAQCCKTIVPKFTQW